MLINETPPSVRRIETDREDVCAFEVTGRITASDMENMYGLLEGAYALYDRIDLIVIVHDYEGFDWGAVWKQQTMLGKTHALEHIRKYAVVGGPRWTKPVVTLLRPFFAMRMRYFEPENADSAWEWLGARPRAGPA